MQETALFGALTLLPFLPWLLKNWWQTGNPFYPFFGWLVSREGSPAVLARGEFRRHRHLRQARALYGENIWQIVALPLRLFFSGQDDNPQYFDGVLTPMLIVFLPWVVQGQVARRTKNCSPVLRCCCFSMRSFLVDLRMRYVLVDRPAAGDLSGLRRVQYLSPDQAAGDFICRAYHCSRCGMALYLWNYFAAAAPLALSNRQRRAAMAISRACCRSIRRFAISTEKRRRHAKIYLLFIGRRAYYCERNYFHDGGELPGFLLGAIRNAKDIAQIEQSLRRKQITHLMVREDLLADFLSNNLTPIKPACGMNLPTRRLRLNFRERGHARLSIEWLTQSKLSIIIPVFNEAANLKKLLGQIHALELAESEIIVVDDGSSDGSAEIAMAAGANVVRHPYNIGNGAAVKSGMRAAKGKVHRADGRRWPTQARGYSQTVGRGDHFSHGRWRARQRIEAAITPQRWPTWFTICLASYVTRFQGARI